MSGAVIIARQNQMMRRFRQAGAIGPESARMLADVGVRDSWLFRRMAARGVFIRVVDGHFYMDEACAAEFVHRRKVRVWTVTAVFAVIFIAVVFFCR